MTVNKPPIKNKDIAFDEWEQSHKEEGSVNMVRSEEKPNGDDSPRYFYVVDQQKFQFILSELSSIVQTVAQTRDELLKRIEEESNERSKSNGKAELE